MHALCFPSRGLFFLAIRRGLTVGRASVGVQPLWWTCEECEFCTSGREQLCHQRKITGEHVNGGHAEYMLSNAAITVAPSDAVTEQALRALRWGGTLASGVPLNVSGFPFDKAQTIKASILGNREQMRTVLRLAADGKIRTVVDRFPMPDALDVLGLLAAGKLRSRAVLENQGN